jgi:hypothetical protein
MRTPRKPAIPGQGALYAREPVLATEASVHDFIPPAPRGAAAIVPKREQPDVLWLAPVLLARLPLPTTLYLSVHGTPFAACTGRAEYEALCLAGTVTLTGSELGALAVGAELDRGSWVALQEWLGAKRTIDVGLAVGGLVGAVTPEQRWPLWRVLRAWDVELLAVEVGQ